MIVLHKLKKALGGSVRVGLAHLTGAVVGVVRVSPTPKSDVVVQDLS